MIYLIGGAPRCGKTTLAQKLSKDLKISWLAADSLEGVVAAYLSNNDLNIYLPKSVMRKKTKQSNDTMYNKYSTKEITNAYIKQSKVVWKAIRELVRASLFEGHDLIIEGHQIHPKLVSQLKNEFKDVKPVVIVRTDLKSIVSGALKSTKDNDWFIKKTKNSETYNKVGSMIKMYSEYYIKESAKHGLKVIDTGSNFQKQINLATKYLESMR